MHIELTENDSGALLALSSQEADRMALASVRWRKALKLPVLPLSVEKRNEGLYLVRAVGVAGFIKVGSVSLDIAPKFLDRASAGEDWRTSMWRFLAYGEGHELIENDAPGATTRGSGIADVLADAFLRSVARGHVMGYPLGYRQEKEESVFMKGRLDPASLERLVPFRGRVPVIASRLTRDVPINQLLKWAGVQLASLVERSNRRKRLMEWTNGMADVSPLPPYAFAVANPKPQYPHLAPAVDIGRILLADFLGAYGGTAMAIPGFLWNSDNLFERAMTRLVADAARPLGMSASKRPHRLLGHTTDNGPRYTTTNPDIDVFDTSGSRLIIDAKYKVTTGYPSSDDTYQVLAAGRVARVEDVALVYPASSTGLATKEFDAEGNGLPHRVTLMQIGLESFKTRSTVRGIQQQVQNWLAEKISRSGSSLNLGRDV